MKVEKSLIHEKSHMNILIIDDSLVNSQKIKKALEKNNYTILQISNIFEAKKFIDSKHPDLIVLKAFSKKFDLINFLEENKNDLEEVVIKKFEHKHNTATIINYKSSR